MAIFNPPHHRALARSIARADRYDDGELIGPAVVEAIITMLAADNAAFDRATFEADAGLAEDDAG